MNNEVLREMALAHGFAAAYFVAAPRYTDEALISKSEDGSIIWDCSRMPYDTACILVWAYEPFSPSERIPSYYINSNSAYHAAVKLARELEAMGVPARRAELPVKSLLYDNGIAMPLKSSLACIPPYGTRMAIQSLLLQSSAENSFRAEEYHLNAARLCETCRICENACPAGAITSNGYDMKRCMRYYMDDPDYPDWVYEKQRTHIGCEVCQQVCPHNARLPIAEPTDEMRRAYELSKLASGDTKAARLLVGKNITGHGKLQKEAINFINRGIEK